MVAYIEAKDVDLTFTPPNRAPVTALQGLNVVVEEGEFVSAHEDILSSWSRGVQ